MTIQTFQNDCNGRWNLLFHARSKNKTSGRILVESKETEGSKIENAKIEREKKLTAF
jgi:hypothetical protein